MRLPQSKLRQALVIAGLEFVSKITYPALTRHPMKPIGDIIGESCTAGFLWFLFLIALSAFDKKRD
jgi:hypothetical protein